MTINIQSLPSDVHLLIFQKLSVSNLKNIALVCKKWQQIVKKALIIDVPDDLVIEKDLTTLGPVLIRALSITGKEGICITGQKVTLVARKIDWNGPIKAFVHDKCCQESWVKGPLPGGCNYSYSNATQPDFWTKLLAEHR